MIKVELEFSLNNVAFIMVKTFNVLYWNRSEVSEYVVFEYF
jgi:hypothetical protein